MKKILVGLGVIIVFIAYSLWVRHEQPALQISSKPVTTTQSNANNTQQSGTDTSGGATGGGSSSNGATAAYKNGTYTGTSEDASYGNVQVAAVVSGGKLADVTILQYPNSHSDSVAINQQALPLLKQEAIQAQSASVDIISGATFTSEAFAQSLRSALSQAQNT